jgi:hypothetical protein
MYSILTLCSRVKVIVVLILGFLAFTFRGKVMNGRGTNALETLITLHQRNLKRGLVRWR